MARTPEIFSFSSGICRKTQLRAFPTDAIFWRGPEPTETELTRLKLATTAIPSSPSSADGPLPPGACVKSRSRNRNSEVRSLPRPDHSPHLAGVPYEMSDG